MQNLHLPITDIAPLLPHKGHMVLLDRIVEYSNHFLCAHASVAEGHILLCDGALPCTLAVEIMAQGVAAWAGCHARSRGEPIRMGFLLGCRSLKLFTQTIPIGTQLRVDVHASIHDPLGMGVFDCELHWQSAPPECLPLLPADSLLIQGSLGVLQSQSSQIPGTAS